MRYLYISLLLIAISPSRVKGQIITTVAGDNTAGYSGDGGPSTAALLFEPISVVVDALGNLYIADFENNVVRMVNTAGIINTIAGNGTNGYNGDGGFATAAKLNGPKGVALDVAGNLYIADWYNNRIRKVTTAGIISTFAGNGTGGDSGDGGTATTAELASPTGVALDNAGNLYIADFGNNRIRKVNTVGIISTVAGNGTQSYSGDGGLATFAELSWPFGVAFDAAGNLYIADYGNDRIRKVNTAGIINTVAGNGTQGYSGDEGPATSAELNSPFDIASDTAGNLYIGDSGNSRIRKINTAGIITTFAGNGTFGYIGDGGTATAAELAHPTGVALDATGSLYIADAGDNRIRKVTNVITAGMEAFANSNEEVTVYPNPSAGIFQVSFSGNSANTSIEIYNMTGECVFRQIITSATCEIDISALNSGVYVLALSNSKGRVVKRLIKE